MTIERRKYVRFMAKDDSFAALRNGFKKVGKISDISVGGLAFSYLSEITEIDNASHISEVDIFLSGNGFHLSNVPCRIVYEAPGSTPDEGFLVRMSSCGLMFGELNGSQLEQLELFIENYTRGVLSS